MDSAVGPKEEAQQLERDVDKIKLDAYKLDKTREKYGLECSLANSKYMSAVEACAPGGLGWVLAVSLAKLGSYLMVCEPQKLQIWLALVMG
eukprot:Skav214699  [mRNA]  locus=scaffold1127:156048:158000:+ [translate_table: standard]